MTDDTRDPQWILHNPPPDTGQTHTDRYGNVMHIPPGPPEVFLIGECEIASAELYASFPEVSHFLEQIPSDLKDLFPTTRVAIDHHHEEHYILTRLRDLDPDLYRRWHEQTGALNGGQRDALAPEDRALALRQLRDAHFAFREENKDGFAAARTKAARLLRDDLLAMMDRYGPCTPQAFALKGGNRHTLDELRDIADYLAAL